MPGAIPQPATPTPGQPGPQPPVDHDALDLVAVRRTPADWRLLADYLDRHGIPYGPMEDLRNAIEAVAAPRQDPGGDALLFAQGVVKGEPA